MGVGCHVGGCPAVIVSFSIIWFIILKLFPVYFLGLWFLHIVYVHITT